MRDERADEEFLDAEQGEQYRLARAGRYAEAAVACESFIDRFRDRDDAVLRLRMIGTLALLCSCLRGPADGARLSAAAADLEQRSRGSRDLWVIARLSDAYMRQIRWLLTVGDDVLGAIEVADRLAGLLQTQSDPDGQAEVGADALHVGVLLCWRKSRRTRVVELVGVLSAAVTRPAGVAAGSLLRAVPLVDRAAHDGLARARGGRTARRLRDRSGGLECGIGLFDALIDGAHGSTDLRVRELAIGAMVNRASAELFLGRARAFKATMTALFELDADELSALLTVSQSRLDRQTRRSVAIVLMVIGSDQQRRIARHVYRGKTGARDSESGPADGWR